MAIRQIQETEWHPWFRAAMAFGRQNQSWFAVQRGTEQDSAWLAYFQSLGRIPMIVRKAEKEYTMPIEWPSWLPHDWEPLKAIPAVVRQSGRPKPASPC